MTTHKDFTLKATERNCRNGRTAKTESDGTTLLVSLFDGEGVLVSGQAFTANPSTHGPERAAQMAERWTR